MIKFHAVMIDETGGVSNMDEDEKVAQRQEHFGSLGWGSNIAEALAESGKDADDVDGMTIYEVMDTYLKWNGIIGYTDEIISAMATCQRMKGGE